MVVFVLSLSNVFNIASVFVNFKTGVCLSCFHLFHTSRVFRLAQRVSRKTKKHLLLSLFHQQKCEIWILLMMPVKFWLHSRARWRLEAILSMKGGRKNLKIENV